MYSFTTGHVYTPLDRERRFRDLIRLMSRNNPRWGAPRIHGELLKLGIEITEPTEVLYAFLVLAHDRRRIPLRRDGSSDCKVDGPVTSRGLSLGQCASLSAA